MSVENFINSIAVFSALPFEAKEEVARSSSSVSLSDRSILFRSGHLTDEIFVLASGLLRLDACHPNGKGMMIGLMSTGHMTDYHLSDQSELPVTASTIGNAEVVLLPKPLLKSMMNRHPEFMESFFSAQDDTRRYLLKLLCHAVAVGPEVRLARILLSYCKIFGARENDQLDYELSQSDLAGLVGISRQSAGKIIRKWALQNVISMKYTKITVLNAPKLCAVAQWGHGRWANGVIRSSDSIFSRLSTPLLPEDS